MTFPGEPRPANIIARVPQTKFNAAGRTPLSSSFQLQEPQNSSFLLNVSANPIVSGSLVTVGALKSGSNPGQSITFQNHPEGEGAPFSPFFTGTTDGNGFTSVTRAFSENQTFVATSGGTQSYHDPVTLGVDTGLTDSGTSSAFSSRRCPICAPRRANSCCFSRASSARSTRSRPASVERTTTSRSVSNPFDAIFHTVSS